MRRIGALACLLIAVFALFVADRAARSGEDGVRRYADGSAPTATPREPRAWWEEPHPPRDVQVDVVVRAEGDEVRVTQAYDIVLRPGDPLVAQVRTGRIGSDELASRLAGGSARGMAVLTYANARDDVHASFQSSYTEAAGPVTVSFQVVPLTLETPAGVRRTVRIQADGYAIWAVGGEPERQDRTHAVLTGTGAFSVRLDADAAPPTRDGGPLPEGIAWLLVMFAPWLALAPVRRMRRAVGAVFAAGLAIGVTVLASRAGAVTDRAGAVLVCVGVPAVLLTIARVAGVARPRVRTLAIAATAVAGTALVPAALVATQAPPMPSAAGWALLFGPLAGAAAMALARRSAVLGAAAALAGVATVLGAAPHGWAPLAVAAIGVMWVLPLAIALPARRPWWWLGGGLLAGALLLVPLQRPDFAWDVAWPELAERALMLGNLVLAGALVVLLARAGRDRRALRDRGIVVAAVVLVLCVAIDAAPYTWAHVAALGVLWGGLLALAGSARGRLVSVATHARLVRAELRRRMLRAAAGDVFRGARAKLAGGTALEEYDETQARLDAAVERGGRPVDGVPAGHALATDAGRSPWANALAAIGYAAPAAVLLVAYEVVAMVQQDDGAGLRYLSLLELADVARHLLRWPVYAGLFGYCYPLLRGRGPNPKALGLAAVVLVAELLPILADPRATAGGRQLAIAVLLRAGQVLVFFVVLGLLWERRLAVLADVGWSRLRDMRRITTLATPVGTVVLTVVTALGTALAGAAAAALIASQTPAPQAPRPAPSSSR
ncbi:hypothetical protein ACQP00_12290 [Dactylosporangium sp. CS-047395]|uniref:hypothetical protein n=1 Tax=Dactylosporangium sp. CS-047395 TaxID=3239936 RepID=UPI003D917B55